MSALSVYVDGVNIVPLPDVIRSLAPDGPPGPSPTKVAPPVTSLPRPLDLLRSATLADGSRVDVELTGATVTAVVPAGSGAGSRPERTLDLDGFVLLPAPADPHSHLDKARSWDAIRPPAGDLPSAIASWRTYAAHMSVVDVAARARAQALAMLANGTTAVRSHVDVLMGDEPLRGVQALLQVRAELAGLIDIELVALCGQDTPDHDIEAALDLGFDTVGGAPHLADDPVAELHRLLDIAQRRGVDVDLHTDESLGGPVTLGAFADRVTGWPQNVSAGHCVRLGTLPALERDALVARAVSAGIGIIANPMTNLFLQGWDHPESTPRGLPSPRALLDAGARFAAGADNVRDPFNPLGRSDALETAMLLVVAGHLTPTEAYAAVSSGAREVMGLPVAGPFVGAVAELLAVRGGSLPEVIATAPADRFVIHGGALVAHSSVSRYLAAATPARITSAPVLTPLLESR